MNNGLDLKSVALCASTFLLKIMSEVTADDMANIAASMAALTTVVYNMQRMYSDRKNKK